MFSLIPVSDNSSHQAVKLFITILIILLLGKLITLIPVMQQLQLADTFNAGEVIWFLARLTSLFVFILFAHFFIAAIPNNGGILSFVKGTAEPFTLLLIVIVGHALFWQMLEPFVDELGRTVYNSVAIILIVSASVWFILRAYRDSLYILNALRKVSSSLSLFAPQQRVNCDQCHAEISTNTAFCSQCGHRMKKPLCCPQCSEPISDDQLYCQSCGVCLNEENKQIDEI